MHSECDERDASYLSGDAPLVRRRRRSPSRHRPALHGPHSVCSSCLPMTKRKPFSVLCQTAVAVVCAPTNLKIWTFGIWHIPLKQQRRNDNTNTNTNNQTLIAHINCVYVQSLLSLSPTVLHLLPPPAERASQRSSREKNSSMRRELTPSSCGQIASWCSSSSLAQPSRRVRRRQPW